METLSSVWLYGIDPVSECIDLIYVKSNSVYIHEMHLWKLIFWTSLWELS